MRLGIREQLVYERHMAASRDPFDVCGSTIDGKYRVVSLVGEGGFGVVYRGLHVAFDEPIAIKCLKFPGSLDDEGRKQLLERLHEEGRLLHRLSKNSSSIVQALDVGALTTASGIWVPYMVLEWLEGETLTAYLAGRRTRHEPIGLHEAMQLLEPAARALGLAHAQKVVHRDVKPENLFVVKTATQQTIKVLDFGIAKTLASNAEFTASLAATHGGPSAFTPRYGTPEQFNKKRGATGPWTDVFALALVFVEVITGKPALEGDDVTELFLAACDPALRPTPRRRGVMLPDSVEQVLEKALAVEPRARYADAGAFWDALVIAAKDMSIAPTPALAQQADAKPLGAADELLATADFAAQHNLGLTPTSPENSAAAATDDPETHAPGPEATEQNVQAEVLTTTRPVAAAKHVDSSAESVSVSQPKPSNQPLEAAPNPPGAMTEPRTTNRRIALAVAGVVALGMLGLAWRNKPMPVVGSPMPAPPSAMGSAAAPVISENPEALRLYEQALQAYRDGATSSAVRMMRQAISLDKHLLAGRLRLAFWKPMQAREEVTFVQSQRSKLSARDQALLEAAEPYLRQPRDFAESEAKLLKALERFPKDVEFLVYLGAARTERSQYDAAIEAFDQALTLDPEHRSALVQKAKALTAKGDSEGARQAYSSCIEKAPGATVCLSGRAYLLGRLGECKEMEADARRLIAVEPQNPDAHHALALALAANGATKQVLLKVAEQGWSQMPEAERTTAEKEQRVMIEMLSGDFGEAARLARLWQTDIAAETDQFTQAEPARRLAWIYREMGDQAAAGNVATEFLSKMGAWTEPAAGGGPAIGLLPFALQAGTLSRDDMERERKAWQEKLRSNWAATRGTGPALDWNLWIGAYACPAHTPEQATEALAHMPTSPAPSASGRSLDFDACFGKTLVLAKQYDRAIDSLRRVAHSCGALSVPIPYMESQLYLGLALEHSNDPSSAQVFYRMIVNLWGKARPRSVTAEQAQKRLKALEAATPAAKQGSTTKPGQPVYEPENAYSVTGRKTFRGAPSSSNP